MIMFVLQWTRCN